MAKQTAKETGTGGVNFLDYRTKAIFDFMAKAAKKTNRQFLDFLVWEYFKKKYANKEPVKEPSRRKPGRKPRSGKPEESQGVAKGAAPEGT